MKYKYEYNKEYQTLQQFDANGVLRSSMSMPQSDLHKLVILSYQENFMKDVDLESEFDV